MHNHEYVQHQFLPGLGTCH